MSSPTLQELLSPAWGPEQPKTLAELVHAEYDTLDETARNLRKQVIEVAFSFERQPLLNARMVREALERHHLPAKRDRWNVIVLDEKRERVYDRGEGTSMRMRTTSTKNFPTIEKLRAKNVTLPENGQYLIIYGGGVEALTEDALEAYRNLTSVARVADLLLWDNQDDVATFWSLRTGCGSVGNDHIEFPDKETLRRWQES
jgi:hypothetical protein